MFVEPQTSTVCLLRTSFSADGTMHRFATVIYLPPVGRVLSARRTVALRSSGARPSRGPTGAEDEGHLSLILTMELTAGSARRSSRVLFLFVFNGNK